uniref:Uncharacterized protein n=1 Tax=Rhizophora mucronata TaxID=61149 RepID=A0A2P2MI52_RHIMU
MFCFGFEFSPPREFHSCSDSLEREAYCI